MPIGRACTANSRCAIRGGLLRGSWLTALTSDLGASKFDGAWLVQNFENQNPSNTLWTKQRNVYGLIEIVGGFIAGSQSVKADDRR